MTRGVQIIEVTLYMLMYNIFCVPIEITQIMNDQELSHNNTVSAIL